MCPFRSLPFWVQPISAWHFKWTWYFWQMELQDAHSMLLKSDVVPPLAVIISCDWCVTIIVLQAIIIANVPDFLLSLVTLVKVRCDVLFFKKSSVLIRMWSVQHREVVHLIYGWFDFRCSWWTVLIDLLIAIHFVVWHGAPPLKKKKKKKKSRQWKSDFGECSHSNP